MYQALYRKYRPDCFCDVVGQEHITDILRNELKSGKIFHAYLFTGPRGTGKTSCAKILAKAVNCLDLHDGDACLECDSCRAIDRGDVLDITEIDAASNNGVENIRDLREQVSYTPSSSKYRVYIIDEVHMLSIGAFNALLKTLEEPPAHIVFILATTEVHKLPATILSRCQRFDFHRILPEIISARLKNIAKKEGFAITDEAADMIAALSDGGMRDALSTLDLCAARNNNITETDVSEVCSLAGNSYCLELAETLKLSDAGSALLKIDNLHKNAVDLMRLTHELIGHYRNLLVAKTVKNPEKLIICTKEVLEKIKSQANDYSAEAVVNTINVLTEALDRMTVADRRTELETAVVRICNPSLDSSPSALLDRLERLERTLKYAKPVTVTADEMKPQLQEVTEEQPDLCEDDGIPPSEREEIKTENLKETPNTAGPERFEAWGDVLAELSRSAPLMAATLSGSNAYVDGDLLLIDSKNDQFFSLMRSGDPVYNKQIKTAVMQIVGRTYRLGPYKKAAQKSTDPLDDVIKKLKMLEVPKD
jgi:DNA polymerase-3 subunit gamma/tau